MPPVTQPPPAAAKPKFAPFAPPQPLWQRVGARTAVASGAFCLVIALMLAAENSQHKSATYPIDHPQLTRMKEDLAKNAPPEQLKKDIRALDLKLRIAHEQYLAHIGSAQWLLFGGMAVFLASLQTAVWRKKIARPGKLQKPSGWQRREIMQSSVAVAMLGLVAGGGAWLLVKSSATSLPAELVKPGASGGTASLAPFPAPEEVARNWGRFRGPGGAGVSAWTNVPLTWNVQTGEGVLWKTAAPGPDFNSPVVWENRLFLTSGTAKKREVFCYDTGTGQLLWQKAVENVPGGGVPVELPEVSGGMACPTAATDGRRVYAMFANGDLAAFDYNGNLAWARSLAPIKNPYGHAASLELWQDRLIIQLDHGDSDTKISRLVALNTADGNVVWEKPRASQGTWSSPIVIEAAGKPQIITLGLPHVIAYAANDGAELWRVEGIDGEVTPSPIFAGGFVLAPSPATKLMAIKPDGAGDVTKTRVAWAVEDGVPDITSPVSDGQRVYLLQTGGNLTCCDLQTGKKIWDKDLESEFKASPSLAGDRLYLASAKSNVVVVAAGPEFKELARIDLGDEVTASPAFADGRIFFRMKQSVICVGNKPR